MFSGVRDRISHLVLLLRQSSWGRVLGVIWLAWGLFQTFRDEFLSAAFREKHQWKLPDMIPDLSLGWWTAIFLGLVALSILEGSYRIQQNIAAPQSKRKIRDALAVFLTEGKQLMGRCGDETQPPPDEETTLWHENLKKFLNNNMESSYVARLENPSGLPMAMNSIDSLPHRNLWAGIHFRLARLNQFIEELAD